MCIVNTPDAAPPVPERAAAAAPDGGDPMVRNSDRARRRLAIAASIFTPQGNATLGVPAVAGAGGNATLGA